MTVCFAFCKLCDISGLDKFEVVNYFSSLGDGYDGEGPVRRMVVCFDPTRFPAENPLSYLLYVHLPKDSETKKAFLKNVKTQYYYLDYTKFTGACHLKEVYEYFS